MQLSEGEVTSLDARALVSEIQQLLEATGFDKRWTPAHEDATALNLMDDGYREPNARLLAAAPRLLTAALGLIEQQQEEIRKSNEIIRASDVVSCVEHGDLPRPATR
jgi:hypothetical protein